MRRIQIVSTASYLVALVILVALSVHATDGHLIYTLDDPYIHLAVAENILRGGYGVNITEFSSPSSSILWPYLLAFTLLLGFGDWGPLILGGVFTAISIWLVTGYFLERACGADLFNGKKKWLLFILIPLLILSINGVALPMTGMEHPLHVLGCVLVILGLDDMTKRNRMQAGLLLGIFLCSLTRFEGVVLSLAAIAAIAYEKKFFYAIVLLLALVAVIGTYVIYMTSLGLPALPSSVLVKSHVTASAMEGGLSAVFVNTLRKLYFSLRMNWGALFLLSSAFLYLAAFRNAPNPDRDNAIVAVAIPAIFALIAHILFGKYGWVGRHEVYAVVIMLLSILSVWSKSLLDIGPPATRIIFLSTLLGILAVNYLRVTVRTPAAAKNIYEQQYQMHRFATSFFPYPVAVNDLGWVAYHNDNYVLDLWGLGSEESRRIARTGGRTADAIQLLAQKKSVSYAMLYDAWFGEAIPKSWCRIAVLHTSRVTAGSDEVAFYLIDRDQYYGEMMTALTQFGPTLPSGASLSVLGCPD